MKRLFDVYVHPEGDGPIELLVVLEEEDLDTAKKRALKMYGEDYDTLMVFATPRESYPKSKQHLLRR